jgi:hypothetical protein
MGFVRFLGWVLILAGIGAVVVAIAGVVTGRVSGGILPAVYIAAPGILVIVIGRAMSRAGKKRTGDFSEQWTRRGAPSEPSGQ